MARLPTRYFLYAPILYSSQTSLDVFADTLYKLDLGPAVVACETSPAVSLKIW